MNKKLTATTDVGVFSRRTDCPYSHVVVTTNPYLQEAHGIDDVQALSIAWDSRLQEAHGIDDNEPFFWSVSWHRRLDLAVKAVNSSGWPHHLRVYEVATGERVR